MTLEGGSFGRNGACVLCNTDRFPLGGGVDPGGLPYGSIASLRSAQDVRVDRSCSNRSAG